VGERLCWAADYALVRHVCIYTVETVFNQAECIYALSLSVRTHST
jgi:hypothetical protein